MISQLKLPFNRSWLLCPLAMNSLLAQTKCGGEDKLSEITTQFKDVPGLNFHSRMFVSPKSTLEPLQNSTVVNFNEFKSHRIISDWVIFILIDKSVLMDENDASLFQMPWFKSEGSNPVMKVYNTFSYTEDIKYEARLLKFPLHYKKCKLVIIVPNETDMVCGLFRRLVESGISSAVQSIQPLFTVLSDMKTLNINYYEENVFLLEKSKDENPCQLLSMGCVNINQEGVLLKCLTCIYSQGQSDIRSSVSFTQTKPFLFTIMFDDVAMFIGQYVSH